MTIIHSYTEAEDRLTKALTLNIFNSVSLLTSSRSNGCFSFTTALHKASRSPNSVLDTPLEMRNMVSSFQGFMVTAALASISNIFYNNLTILDTMSLCFNLACLK